MEDIKFNNADWGDDKTKTVERFFSKDKSEEKPVKRYEPKLLKRICRLFLLILFVLTVGGAGGIIADRWLIPQLVSMPAFAKYAWLERIKENTTIINRTEEIRISEDSAMTDAIARVEPSVAKVSVTYSLEPKTKSRRRQTPPAITENLSGVIITNDGLVLVRPSFFLPPDTAKDYSISGAAYKVIADDQKEIEVNDPGRMIVNSLNLQADDPAANLVILKTGASDLPVATFGNYSSLLLGDHVAVAGDGVAVGAIAKMSAVSVKGPNGAEAVSRKIIYFDRDLANKSFYAGAPLINLKGEVAGLNIVGADGNLTGTFLSIDDIKPFVDFAMGKK